VISKEFNLPFYLKATIFLVGLFIFFTILYIGRSIIIPVVFATILSMVLHPVVNFFVRNKIHRVIAIIITLLLTFIMIGGLGFLLFSQASRFSDSWPVLVDKLTIILSNSINWASGYFDINPIKIHEWIAKAKLNIILYTNSAIGPTLMSVGKTVFDLFLIPVYMFMILFYHPILIDFIRKIFAKSDHTQVNEIITQTKKVIQHYLMGLVIEFIIIAALYSITLWLLGIDYALMLGIIGALLNIIPFVGGFGGIALPMMIALATKDSAWPAVYVLIIFYIIQMIDNHYIIPRIVASKVKINALFALIVIFVGNAIWGIPGMFISIPLLAIVKLIFDHIEPLKPWGFLLGDTMPSLLKIKTIRLLRIKKKTI
jgi:predicted PurR-regulated permease PerM